MWCPRQESDLQLRLRTAQLYPFNYESNVSDDWTKRLYHILRTIVFSVIVLPMNPEERSLLERTHKLAEENNEILRSIRRTNRFSLALRITYWVIIIVVSFGAYYLIQPYVEMLMGSYSQIQGGIGGIQGSITTAQSAAETLRSLLQ